MATSGGSADNSARIGAIDGLRATAFLLVFGFHSWEFAGRPDLGPLTGVLAANTRVDLFIVLAGFCLTLPLARNPQRALHFATRSYLVRRLRRIGPPYYAALLFALLLPWILRLAFTTFGFGSTVNVWPSWGDVLSHLTFTHLFFVDHWDEINGSLWTMSLEMQFYLLFPLLVLAVAKFGYRALLIALAGSVTYRVLAGFLLVDSTWEKQFLWSVTGLGRLSEFAMGMGASYLAIRWSNAGNRYRTLALLGLFVLTYGLGVDVDPELIVPVRDLALGVAFSALSILAVTSVLGGRALSARPLSRLGYMAYSVFLVHQPIVYYISEFAYRAVGMNEGRPMFLMLCTIGLGTVLSIGWLLHRYVERPAIKWSRSAPPTNSTRSAPALKR